MKTCVNEMLAGRGLEQHFLLSGGVRDPTPFYQLRKRRS